MLLTVEGYRVAAAASLGEALVQAKQDTALLITDYHLREGETGADVIAGVRETLGREVPAIVITGDTSSTIREERPGGRVHLVSKPMDAEQLLGLLKTLLSSV